MMSTHPARPRIAALIAVALAFAIAGGVALADDDDRGDDRHEHDRARRALEAGEILPLRMLLDRAEDRQPGRLLEVELEDEHGRIVYEFKILTPEGRVLELYYDARTGDHLKTEGDDE